MVLLRKKLQRQGKYWHKDLPTVRYARVETSHLFKWGCKARRKELTWKGEMVPCPHLTVLAPESRAQEMVVSPSTSAYLCFLCHRVQLSLSNSHCKLGAF